MLRCMTRFSGPLVLLATVLSASATGVARTADDFLLADQVVEHGDAANHVRVYGKDAGSGEYVTIVPSLGRGVEDYTERYDSTIVTRLAEAGYRVVLIQPRGIGRSRGDLTPVNSSMSQFAQDLRKTLDALDIQQTNLVGHAFGNRLSRTFTTLYPDRVNRLALLAAGGNFSMSEQQQTCLRNSFNLALDDQDRLAAIGCAFFAEGNDPSVWLTGWYPELAAAQILSANMINSEFFKTAGGKPFLLLQATEDFIAPPDKAGRVLKAALGDQVTYVEIPHAGHALSSEQPDAIAAQLIEYFAQ